MTGRTNDQKTEQPTGKLLRECDLAERWNTSTRTLQRWRKHQSGPPYVRLGGSIRYRLSDIEAFELRGLYDSNRAEIAER